MKNLTSKYTFPGSFCPPTYGHLEIVKKAAKTLGPVTIVCSRDSDKKYLFTESECADFWRTYELPKNVEVVTFEEMNIESYKEGVITMVRGVRGQGDIEHELAVMKYNSGTYDIRNFYYLAPNLNTKQISSSSAREAASKFALAELSKSVSPLVATALLERALGIDNLYLVVGKPGVGKSSFLKAITENSGRNAWIDTDKISRDLRPLLEEHFPDENLVDVATYKATELTKVIEKEWLEILSQELYARKGAKNIFVEVGYGLAPGKELYRYLGGKILYIGCTDKIQQARLEKRGNPELIKLSEITPDLAASRAIAKAERLKMTEIINNDNDIIKLSDSFLRSIN